MNFFKSLFGNQDSGTHCARCGMPMYIITGKMLRTEDFKKSQGCFQCGNCGRYTCYDCSDSREPCDCGKKNWIEKSYLTDLGDVGPMLG